MKRLVKYALILFAGLNLTACETTPGPERLGPEIGEGSIIVKLPSNVVGKKHKTKRNILAPGKVVIDPKNSGIHYAQKLALSGVLGDSLTFYKFDGEESEALAGTAKAKMSAKNRMAIYESEDGYLTINVKPGRYFLASVDHQTYWAGCLNKRTTLFDVKPNEATHLGTIDISSTIREIQSFGSQSKDQFVKEQGDRVEHYYPNLSRPPTITPPNNADLRDAAQSFKNTSPDFNLPVVSGNNRPFTFFALENKNFIRGLPVYTSISSCGTR